MNIFQSKAIDNLTISDGCFTQNGLEIADFKLLVSNAGYDKFYDSVILNLPDIISGGIQNAPKGIIQDPAGSAIGQIPSPAIAGGGSGAIYAKFPDLKLIPEMHETGAVFNSSTGPGRRVLHSYSPMLNGYPDNPEDRAIAIQDITNTYINAFLAIEEAVSDSGHLKGESLVNLIPVSAGIFADNFKDSHLDSLRPSYTIGCIMLAMAYFISQGKTLLKSNLYNYSKPQHPNISAVSKSIIKSLKGK